MEPEKYWRLKSRFLEIEKDSLQVNLALNTIETKRIKAYEEAGLERNKNYSLNDDTLSIEEIVPQE